MSKLFFWHNRQAVPKISFPEREADNQHGIDQGEKKWWVLPLQFMKQCGRYGNNIWTLISVLMWSLLLFTRLCQSPHRAVAKIFVRLLVVSPSKDTAMIPRRLTFSSPESLSKSLDATTGGVLARYVMNISQDLFLLRAEIILKLFEYIRETCLPSYSESCSQASNSELCPGDVIRDEGLPEAKSAMDAKEHDWTRWVLEQAKISFVTLIPNPC